MVIKINNESNTEIFQLNNLNFLSSIIFLFLFISINLILHLIVLKILFIFTFEFKVTNIILITTV